MEYVLSRLECTQLTALETCQLDTFVTDVLASLDSPTTVPFQSDGDYLNAMEAVFVVEHQRTQLQRNFQSQLFRVPVVAWDPTAERLQHLVQRFATLRSALQEFIELKIAAAEDDNVPRVLRVCRRLGLEGKERDAFVFVLLQHSGVCLPHLDSINVATGGAMAKSVGMTPKEWLHFIGEGRSHLQQGLVEVDQMYRDSLASAVLKMPTEVIAALVGAKLSQPEALKIDKTCLADVLAEEADAASLAALDAGISEETPPDVDVSPSDDKPNVAKEDDDAEVTSEVSDYVGDIEFELYSFMKQDAELDGTRRAIGTGATESEFLAPYTTDVEYLDDVFQLITVMIKIRNAECDAKEDESNTKAWKGERSSEAVMRELRGKERVLKNKVQRRLENTQRAGEWLPRAERLAAARHLCEFEKMVLLLLVGSVVSHDLLVAIASGFSARRFSRDLTVGFVLLVLCDTLAERVHGRSYFYKSAALVKDAMLKISDRSSSVCDLMECSVDIDRRMLDYIVGLETEFNELVDGSHLYLPTVPMEQVILPEEKKSLVLTTVANFNVFKACKKRVGVDDVFAYGAGLVLLFYGQSGTGKTMMANAIANHLQRKLLLVNWNSLNATSNGDLLKYIFREAKLHDALIFFDECESFFESRQRNSHSIVTVLLTEIERFDGLMILATNRAYDLDDAMHRRITLAIEFKAPDHELRRKIWANHLPDLLCRSPNIDFAALAMNFELSGGLIKNAVLSAISVACAREGGDPVVTMEDLVHGATTQLRGAFQKDSPDKKFQPTQGVDELVLDADAKAQLKDVVRMDRGRKVLLTQYGVAESSSVQPGTLVLLYGPPGCGKGTAAAAIGYECGYSLKVVHVSELLSKYPSESYKNVEKIFNETRKTNSMLVFEEAEKLLGAEGQSTARNVLVAIRSAAGTAQRVVVLVFQTEDRVCDPPDKFLKRVGNGTAEMLDFDFRIPVGFPSVSNRIHMWRRCLQLHPRLLPQRDPGTAAPSTDIPGFDWSELGSLTLSLGEIHHACLLASTQVVLREPAERVLTCDQLLSTARSLMERRPRNDVVEGLYS